MSIRLSALAVLACAFSLSLGCSSALELFTCEHNSNCAGEGVGDGQCEPSQVCSFADSTCGENGQRYGKHSGEVSNQCVGDEAGVPDAANVEPAPDADLLQPDAGDQPANPDAATLCVMLNMIVYDDHDGDDEVRVKVNGNLALVCSPDSVPLGSDSMVACEVCLPIGAAIRLKADSGFDLSALITDCAPNCYNDGTCDFTATVSCSSTHYFDVDNTTIPPD